MDAPGGLAVHRGRGTAARITWTDAAARDHGVRPGQTLAAAHARCATLDSALEDDSLLAEARRLVVATLLRLTPRISPAGPARFWCEPVGSRWTDDVRAALRGWGPVEIGIGAWAAAAYAAALADRPPEPATQKTKKTKGVPDALDGAGSPEPATQKTKKTKGVPAGLDAAGLAVLELDPRTVDDLRALGVRDVRSLRALDPIDLGVRFGPEVARAWRYAHGDDPRGPRTPRVVDPPTATIELEDPIDQLEPLLFLLRPALEHLLAEPAARGMGATTLQVELHPWISCPPTRPPPQRGGGEVSPGPHHPCASSSPGSEPIAPHPTAPPVGPTPRSTRPSRPAGPEPIAPPPQPPSRRPITERGAAGVAGPARKRGPKGRSAGTATHDDPIAQITIRSAAPLTDPRLALELARTHLERQTLRAPIKKIVLTTIDQAPRPDPNEPLFPEPRRDRAAHDVAITRLTSRFGADRVTRASRVELPSPRARAAWTGADAAPGVARPWRQQDPPAPVRDAHVDVAGRRRRVVRIGRVERALAPFWLTGALRVERLAWAEVDGPLLVMLRACPSALWEAVAWVD